MLTRLSLIGCILLALPVATPAWELSAVQEEACRNVGSFATTIGDIRDIPIPRSQALLVIEKAGYLSPQDNTMLTGVIYWVYEHHTLGSTELYVEMVKACRNELTQRYETETKAQMRTGMATICAKEADIGAALAVKARTMTQAQAFRMLQDVDPNYADNTELYGKLVPFVYQRRKLAPADLRVAVTQHCRAGHEAVLKQQYGVELEQEKGWRR